MIILLNNAPKGQKANSPGRCPGLGAYWPFRPYILSLRNLNVFYMDLIWITKALYKEGYTLQLTFNDGSVKSFDFSKLFGTHPMYESLKEKETFKDFRLDGWTVSWNNGLIDAAPEFLFENSVTA